MSSRDGYQHRLVQHIHGCGYKYSTKCCKVRYIYRFSAAFKSESNRGAVRFMVPLTYFC